MVSAPALVMYPPRPANPTPPPAATLQPRHQVSVSPQRHHHTANRQAWYVLCQSAGNTVEGLEDRLRADSVRSRTTPS